MTGLDDALDKYAAAFNAGKAAALRQLDLDDPATENAVADAIARLKGGGFLPLSERYPWRFPQIPPGRCGNAFDPSPDLHFSCELLAGHAGFHQETVFPAELGAPPQVASWMRVE